MSKKTIRLTMKELMSLEIGLDTGEEEFIDKDSLDWFPVFVRNPEGVVKAQFFNGDEEDTTDLPVRITLEEHENESN